MKRHDRLTLILELVTAKNSMTIEELMAELGVSAATIRRDLDSLAEQQLITRTRGGAKQSPVSSQLPMRYKSVSKSDPKHAIAKTAATLVSPGDIIGLNGGTTTTEVAREIALLPQLLSTQAQTHAQVTIVTNAINIANELTVRPQVRTMITGGVVRALSYELTGPMAEATLAKVAIDTLFLGVNAIDATRGAFASHEGEAATGAALAACANRVVAVAQSSKLQRTAFARICDISTVDMLITDSHVDGPTLKRFKAAGVEVIIAK